MSKINLKTLLVSNKTATVDFPGYEGFKVNIAFLSRDELVKIRKKATRTMFKGRQPTDELDDELFIKLYSEAAIKGWSGLKLKHLNKLAPIDMTGQDPESELDYDQESALDLMKASSDFDAFISQTVTELTAFSQTNGNK